MGAIMVALVGAALLAIPGSPAYTKPTLGLDLKGGLEVILRATPAKGQQIDAAQMQTAQQIMTQRVNKLGLSSPNVALQGGNEIVIQLAGVHDPAKAAKVIGTTGQLQMFDFETSLEPPTVQGNQQPAPLPSLYSLLTAVKAEANKGSPESYYLFNTVTKKVKEKVKGKEVTKTRTTHSVLQGPAPNLKQLFLPYKNGKQPAHTQVLKVPAHREPVFCSLSAGNGCPGAGANGRSPNGKYWYLFKYTPRTVTKSGAVVNPDGPPQLTGQDLVESGIAADVDPNSGQSIVTLQFTGHGSNEFKRITQPSSAAASKTALVLQSGSLPYKFKQIESTSVSATLGKNSLHQAILAALAGLVIVAIFLVVLYRFLGLVAVAGLAIYALLYYAAILLFGVTLTLPGFAGLILTIGVAADANVVVFERIKEEVRAGKSVRAAISAGYSKGFHTILDANVVTAITALVLFAVATAQVKGFALMLLIGTVISLITAVGATRAMLGLLGGFSWFNKPRFMGAQGQQTARWLQIDFMRKRYLWFAISGAIILLGTGALVFKGLNLGIDFKGGSQLSFKTPVGHTTGAVRVIMGDQGYSDAVIQGRGASTNGEYRSFQVRTKALSGDKLTQVTRELENKLQATAPGATTVSSSFGRQIAKSAIIAIFFSLFLVVLYIAIRFDLKFAGPVIAAMLHDVLICIGIYALLGREVTSSTVAAILTVLGYSIYDTIIIFDRIRENIPTMRRASIATIVNVSLWETIRRSLATSFITLLPVGALFLYGGATLKDFAFALMVGIASGAYSSIFIAAPLLTILKEREPEYARRKGETLSKSGMDAVLEEAEEEAAEEPAPELVPVPTLDGSAAAAAAAKRERRRQRRRARPHGRAR